MKKYTSVESYISSFPQWEDKLRLLRSIILKNPDFEEGFKWSLPVYMIDGKNLLGLGAFKTHISLWFFQGALLKDEANVLVNVQEGKTQAMRHWKFMDSDTVSESLIQTYIDETLAYKKAGKTVLMKKKSTEFIIPDELKSALDTNTSLKTAFEALSNYKQKEYAEHIATAKRAATKESRLKKIVPMILEGKGLNDKYR
ncbi:YdeI/OmpD-associated family protein [uncultured Kordia sp.]|uniref:YdeI/OmpD-associated family protein n=1 Tax=uncultured Kordia sp. TaxID=507699 RepID=UPI002603902F|nr:YdeI/OmpD-associated family protein [uncultured Kordia sp.]